MNRENDLRERYIYAATRGLPRASRADIEQELRTLIDDLLEEPVRGPRTHGKGPARRADGPGHPGGDPRKVQPAPGARADRPGLLPAVSMGAGRGARRAGLRRRAGPGAGGPDRGAGAGRPAAGAAGGIASGLGCGFTAVTLLFAFFERRGVKLERADDTIENLPPVPQHSELIPRWESIAGPACAR